jgi:class 3 adenylate cyclase
MKYCGQCGMALTVSCRACGFKNPLNFRFCGQCGIPLSDEATVPEMIQTVEADPSSQIPLALPMNGSTDQSPRTEIILEGERRDVTVLVTDVTGSTELLEKVGSEVWVDLMNHILHIQEGEIYRFGGEVDQFRGDGLVAFFGASITHEDDPERAVLAALSIQRAIKQYTDELSEQDGIELRIRVGINTGEVILAKVGDRSQHSEDTAMGIAVAVAARMESAAEPGTVLVSENSYRLVTTQFNWQPLGQITVKGVSQPIAVYRPLSPKFEEDPLSHIQVSGAEPPLIGRQVEIKQIQECIEDLYDGRGRIVMVVGDKGMGKMYLMNEVYQTYLRQEALWTECRADDINHEQKGSIFISHPPKWLRGRFRSYDQSWPYSMWVDLFHTWLETHPEETKETTRDRLRSNAEKLWGNEITEYYPYLTVFLSLPLEDNFNEKIKHLAAGELRQRIFFAVRSWIEAMTRQEPLVLMFANLQWADTSSLELLKYCLPVCDQEAILFALLFRPDRSSPAWELRHHIETVFPHRSIGLELAPFTEAQSNEFINWLVGAGSMTKEERTLIYKTSEGNPYYIYELINTLMARGALIRDWESGQWRTPFPITSLDLPDNLQRLLLVRIGRLTPEERYVLQIASVTGRSFWFNVIQAVAVESKSLKADLAALQRAQLIQEGERLPALGMSYSFKTTLVRDAAYDSLLNTQRVIYHAQVAEYLENNINPEVMVGYYGILAYHYRFAQKPKKELFYTLQAAEQAKRLYSNKEALERYNRALELLDEIDSGDHDQSGYCAICGEKFEVLVGRSQIYYLMGDLEAGAQDARALLPLARHMSDDKAWLIDALLNQPIENRKELAEGLAMKEEALNLARQISDRHREMQSLSGIAFIRFALKDTSWKDVAQQALDLARQLGDLKTEVELLLGLRDAYGLDDLPRSREFLESALRKSETLNDKAIELQLLAAIGPQYEREGNYYRQLTEYDQKRLRISREIGDRLTEGQSLMFCGQIQAIYLGDYEAGLALEEEALRIWEQTSNRLYPLLRIAQIQILLGQYRAAAATIDLARPIGDQVIGDLGRAGLALVTAILYNAMGDAEHLFKVFEFASQIKGMVANSYISRQYQMVAACQSAVAHHQLAELAVNKEEQNKHREMALEASQEALDVYQEFGFTQVIECTYEEILFRHSQILLACGNEADADDYLEFAYHEMMRKYDLLPPESNFRKTYLENITLHREIRSLYMSRQVKVKLHDSK